MVVGPGLGSGSLAVVVAAGRAHRRVVLAAGRNSIWDTNLRKKDLDPGPEEGYHETVKQHDHWAEIVWLLVMAAIAVGGQIWDAAGAAVVLLVFVWWVFSTRT